MSEAKLGQLVTQDAKRDAIHVAIAPLEAAHELVPGQHAGVNADGKADTGVQPIGIVDPYLRRNVRVGERFYLCLYPNTVTGMRHQWVHPAFMSDESPVALDKHKAMIAQYAEEAGLDYDEMMEAAEDYLKHGEYLCQGSRWEGHYLEQDFWVHYEAVTGVKVGDNDRGSFFSCSC